MIPFGIPRWSKRSTILVVFTDIVLPWIIFICKFPSFYLIKSFTFRVMGVKFEVILKKVRVVSMLLCVFLVSTHLYFSSQNWLKYFLSIPNVINLFTNSIHKRNLRHSWTNTGIRMNYIFKNSFTKQTIDPKFIERLSEILIQLFLLHVRTCVITRLFL